MWKPIELDTDKTLYIAIVDAIEKDITDGILKPGDKMPTQRWLAEVIGVNLTTITRAYNLARKRGLLTAVTGKGTYVMEDKLEDLPRVPDDDDNIIDFGLVGAYQTETDEISRILKEISDSSHLHKLLSYSPSKGFIDHRLSGQAWIKKHGYDVTVDDVIVCSGVMHGINCALSSAFSYGDTIAVDALTFKGFINASEMHHIHLEPIEMDQLGMMPSALEEACQKGHIKGVYLMPNLQNPTATAMDRRRKEEIAAIIEKYHLILIEDDVYNLSHGENKPLSTWIPHHAIYISGTAKTLFAGLRVAYAVVPPKFQRKFIKAVTTSTWMAPPIDAEIVSYLITSNKGFTMENEKKVIMNRRLNIAKRMLKNYDIYGIDNSQFFWLRLPETIEAVEFENIALLNKVRVLAASKFAVGKRNIPNAIRISLANITSERLLIKGLEIILNILEDPDLRSSQIM